ncbi:eukaryotic translation initiation factor 3 [Ascobolus immersus RN42]|uniref:Eukaryotic translation initiation factor 3 subunit B n=1 Tax=Ascobolus immersus RN42 TaxID=1160509 RepID=A0A3N4HRA4_ASCIM|nr:eukaryotic translation initiation factor 3 [Ascobolus immersus RN42]
MAPSIADHEEEEYVHQEEEEEEDDIDFSDLHEQFEVQMEEGLDAFVVVDGLPVVTEENKPKLVKFLTKRLNEVGRAKADQIFMPIDEATGKSQGYAFVEYETADQATAACKQLSGIALDKKHTIYINKLTDIERYGREGRIDEQYTPPPKEEYVQQEHFRWWLSDINARDQFIMYRGDNVGVFWNKKKDTPEQIVDRLMWTEMFVKWSPLGTFLTSMHPQGVQLWGGQSWKRIQRFYHPYVNMVEYSPKENYLVSWSNRPISLPDGPHPLGPEEEGKNFLVWDLKTGTLLRSFANLEVRGEEEGKRKVQWPVFKWSADEKYLARIRPGQAIEVYEVPGMGLLGKKSVKIEGVVDFEWAPETVKLAGRKDTEQLLAYWTPEMENQSARVGIMAIPSKTVVRTRNLFNVSDCKLHWQSEGKHLCVKVDRHTKTKKSTFTNLEFFRVTEKEIPVELLELKETVINFAWEPKGDRFVIITQQEVPAGVQVGAAPKTSVSFYGPEIKKGSVGNFKLIKTIDKKNSNAIYWSPKGRFVLVGTVSSQQFFDLDFWDLDFDGEKKDQPTDVAANLQLMNTAEHFGVTDVEWDPTGRYVATSASMWKHTMENGYHLWDFKGTLLREEHIDRFKQFLWRPRPPTMLSKEQQKQVRKNLREYSRVFDEEDLYETETANKEVIEARKRALQEWTAWRQRTEKQLREERVARGLPADPFEKFKVKKEEATVIEEIVEEVIHESEEIVA